MTVAIFTPNGARVGAYEEAGSIWGQSGSDQHENIRLIFTDLDEQGRAQSLAERIMKGDDTYVALYTPEGTRLAKRRVCDLRVGWVSQ